MKNVVVEGCEFEIYESGLLNSNGEVEVNSSSIASANVKVDGKKVYTTLKVDVSNYSSNTVTGWVSGSGSTLVPAEITSSALYNNVKEGQNWKPVYLEEDQAIGVEISGRVKSGHSEIPATCIINVKIKKANQTAYKAE